MHITRKKTYKFDATELVGIRTAAGMAPCKTQRKLMTFRLQSVARGASIPIDNGSFDVVTTRTSTSPLRDSNDIEASGVVTAITLEISGDFQIDGSAKKKSISMPISSREAEVGVGRIKRIADLNPRRKGCAFGDKLLTELVPGVKIGFGTNRERNGFFYVGAVKSRLCDAGNPYVLTIPSIVRGRSFSAEPACSAKCRLFTLSSDAEHVLIELLMNVFPSTGRNH